jgi:hypothetical protein
VGERQIIESQGGSIICNVGNVMNVGNVANESGNLIEFNSDLISTFTPASLAGDQAANKAVLAETIFACIINSLALRYMVVDSVSYAYTQTRFGFPPIAF